MKKFTGLLLVIIFLALPFTNASIEKPEWHVGLFWKYHSSVAGNLTIKITGEENLKLNFTSTIYKVWNLTQVPENGKGMRYTYISKNDFSIVKEVDVMGKGKRYEIVYVPPMPTIKYKMNIGETWHGSFQMMEYYGGGWRMKRIDVTLNCTGKEKVKIPLGTYTCYKIIQEKIYDGSREKTILYYSPHFGNWIKIEVYGNGEKKMEMTLVETNYAKENKTPMPGYISLAAMAIALYFFARRKSIH